MITVLYSIEKNQLFDGSSQVTVYLENQVFIFDMNGFADFLMTSKKYGCVLLEKKNSRQTQYGRFQVDLKKMLDR